MIDIENMNKYEKISNELSVKGENVEEIVESLLNSPDGLDKVIKILDNYEGKIVELKEKLEQVKANYHDQYDEIDEKISSKEAERKRISILFKNYISILNDDVATDIRQREIDNINFKLKELDDSIENESLIKELENRKEELTSYEDRYMELQKKTHEEYKDIMKYLKKYQSIKDAIVSDYVSKKSEIEMELRDTLAEKMEYVDILYKLREKTQGIVNTNAEEVKADDESVDNLFDIIDDKTENTVEESIDKPVLKEEMHEIFADGSEEVQQEKKEETLSEEIPVETVVEPTVVEEPLVETNPEEKNMELNEEEVKDTVEFEEVPVNKEFVQETLETEPEEMHEIVADESKEEPPVIFNDAGIEDMLNIDIPLQQNSEVVQEEVKEVPKSEHKSLKERRKEKKEKKKELKEKKKKKNNNEKLEEVLPEIKEDKEVEQKPEDIEKAETSQEEIVETNQVETPVENYVDLGIPAPRSIEEVITTKEENIQPVDNSFIIQKVDYTKKELYPKLAGLHNQIKAGNIEENTKTL